MTIQLLSIIVCIVSLIAAGLWIRNAYGWKQLFYEERRQNKMLREMYLENVNSVNGILLSAWIEKVLDNNKMMEEQNGKQTDSVDE